FHQTKVTAGVTGSILPRLGSFVHVARARKLIVRPAHSRTRSLRRAPNGSHRTSNFRLAAAGCQPSHYFEHLVEAPAGNEVGFEEQLGEAGVGITPDVLPDFV